MFRKGNTPMSKTAHIRNFADAEKWLTGGKAKTYRPVRNNTWAVRIDPDTIGIKFHDTIVVALHRDGSQTLANGGWESVTTRARLGEFSAARIYSVRDQGWAIWHSSDPLTAPKVQKCRARKCKGNGQYVDPRSCYGPSRWGENWCQGSTVSYPISPITEHADYSNPIRTLCEHGSEHGHATAPCRHGETTSHPLPSVLVTCYPCQGTGARDYGSNTIPTIWDGSPIVVDETGKVIGHGEKYHASDYHTSKEKKNSWYATADYYSPAPSFHHVTTEVHPSGTVTGGTITSKLEELVPALHQTGKCPHCSQERSYTDLIIHLNDKHHVSREDIADWLEAQPININFPIPA
jgi:hypothetical protein